MLFNFCTLEQRLRAVEGSSRAGLHGCDGRGM
jgi:hypothetical protein